MTERSHQMLKSLDGLPISKLNTIHVPTIKSEFGDVNLGSALSYQVCNTIHCSHIIIQQKESTQDIHVCNHIYSIHTCSIQESRLYISNTCFLLSKKNHLFFNTGFCHRVSSTQTVQILLIDPNRLVGMQPDNILKVLIFLIALST